MLAGATALASATSMPVIVVGANFYPAIGVPHKWDAARTPMPFGYVTVAIRESRHCPGVTDPTAVEDARLWLQQLLDKAAAMASRGR